VLTVALKMALPVLRQTTHEPGMKNPHASQV
jgi:hypothetical protein